MKVELIDDKDLYDLLRLHHELHSLTPHHVSRVRAAEALLDSLRQKDARGFGLYKNDKLVGFLTGYGLTEAVYYLADIYVEPGSRLGVKRLIAFAESHMLTLGYTAWQANACLPEGARVIKKSGGEKINGYS